MEAEADYLCGAPLHARSTQRTNYRLGYYRRKFCTPIGEFRLRVPHLLYLYPRVSIIKRAKRLSPQILETLSRIYATAPHGGAAALASPLALQPFSPLALSSEAAELVRLLWTLDLPAAHHAALAEKLTPILDQWRAQASEPAASQH